MTIRYVVSDNQNSGNQVDTPTPRHSKPQCYVIPFSIFLLVHDYLENESPSINHNTRVPLIGGLVRVKRLAGTAEAMPHIEAFANKCPEMQVSTF